MTDEVTLRGIWSHYKRVMSQDAASAMRVERRARTSRLARTR